VLKIARLGPEHGDRGFCRFSRSWRFCRVLMVLEVPEVLEVLGGSRRFSEVLRVLRSA
jgi:hypothetical protein